MFQKFVTRPATIEAVRLSRENSEAVKKLIGRQAYDDSREGFDPYNIMLRNKHGNVLASIGDWIIKERDGSGYYPCTDADFTAKYDLPSDKPAQVQAKAPGK